MTRFERCNRSYNLEWQYNYETHSNQIQTIFSNDSSLIRNTYPSIQGEGWINGFVEELGCYAEIISIPEAPLPDIEDTDNDLNRLAKTLHREYGLDTPKFVMCLWTTAKANPAQSDWKLRGKISLLNGAGYPYRLYNPYNLLTINDNIARKFGEGGKIGVSIQQAGWGYPVTGRDVINIDGVFTQELITVQPDQQPLILYITQSNGSTQTQTQPPSITVAAPSGYTGDIYVTDEIDLTITANNLGANQSCTLAWYTSTGTTPLSTKTVTSSTAGTYTETLNSRAFISSPFTGGGTYKCRITVNGISADSSNIVVIAPSVWLSASASNVDKTSEIAALAYTTDPFFIHHTGFKGGLSITHTWQKLVSGSYVDMSSSISGAVTTRTVSTDANGKYQVQLSQGIFAQSGYGGAYYKLKVTKGQLTIQSSNRLIAYTSPPF